MEHQKHRTVELQSCIHCFPDGPRVRLPKLTPLKFSLNSCHCVQVGTVVGHNEGAHFTTFVIPCVSRHTVRPYPYVLIAHKLRQHLSHILCLWLGHVMPP